MRNFSRDIDRHMDGASILITAFFGNSMEIGFCAVSVFLACYFLPDMLH